VSDSIWKKEISLRRKKEAAPEPEVAAPAPARAEPAETKQSVWKKEISLGRKKQPAPEPEPEAAAPAPARAEPAETKQSFWKKEISLGRGKQRARDEEIEAASQVEAAEAFVSEVAAEAPAPPPEPRLQAVPDEPSEQPPAPVVPLPVQLEPVQLEPVEPEPVQLEPVQLESVQSQPVQPEPVPHEPVSLEPVSLEPVQPEPVQPEPVSLEPVQPEPVQPDAARPAAESPELVETAPLAPVPLLDESPAAPEPWLAGPELPPEPVQPEPVQPEPVQRAAEPEPASPAEPEAAAPEDTVVVHPPVPADELPELEGEKVPFWKRELSLSRKTKAPKPPKEPKRRKQPAPEPEAEEDRPARRRGLPGPSLSLPSLRRGHKAKRVVGLKIGTSQLAAARVSNNGVAEVQQLARRPLGSGIVVAGEVRDPDALADALRSFFSANRLPRKGIRLGIASSRIGVRIFEIDGVEGEKRLENAVRFRAQEALPIPLDEAVLDYRVLDETVDAEGQSVKRVLLVVAHRELIDRYVAACRKARIIVVGIDLEAFALLRALAAPADRDGSALVAVSVGHERTTLAVSDGRVCEFTRVVEWGGWALNIALARTLNSTPSDVEAIKRSLSLAGGAAPDGLTPEQGFAAVEAVRRGVESLARELVSSLQFYQAQPGSLGIGEIVITGGTAQMPGLAEELERLVGVRVRVGNPLARLKVGKKIGDEDLGSLAVAIGLGIDD
jgi:type IV pilus assembly protein PilM